MTAVVAPWRTVDRPLIGVLLAGATLRAVLMISSWPTGLGNRDVYPYVASAGAGVFGDPLHPPGYALLLRAAHGISQSVVVPTVLQHLAGLGAAALLYAAARRLGASRPLAYLPAAAFALSGDQLSVEHILMSDAIFSVLVSVATYLLVRSRTDEQRRGLAALLCGATLGASYLVRSSGLVLGGLYLVAMAYESRRRLRIDLPRLALGVIGGAAVVVPVLVVQHESTGRWSAQQAVGWALYTKAAPFADCSRFTPPAGTEILCEESDPDNRPGPDYYAWGGGPARETFGDFTVGNEALRSFALASITAQPLDLVTDAGGEFARFFVPGLGPRRPASAVGSRSLALDVDHPETAAFVEVTLEEYYDDFTVSRRPRVLGWLAAYQRVGRGGSLLLTAGVAVAAIGMVVADGRRRRWLATLLGAALLSLAFAAATTVYTARYAVPLFPVTMLAAAVGGQAFAESLSSRRPRTPS